MQHSYEALDRPGGTTRAQLFAPLRHRDFRRLWSGMTLSLVGDGAFLVAMTWQVYVLSDAPTALAFVGIAMSIPTIVLLLVGGAVSDRVDRRRVMVASDLIRGGAVGLLALMTLSGGLALWHVVVLCAVYGAATAFFNPAFDAIVPDLLPESDLAQANALDQLVRPIAFRLAGPALGGWLVASIGAGSAFALDAATFVISAAAIGSMRYRRPDGTRSAASIVHEIREGFAFVRAHVWLWGTLVSAAFAYLAFMGPTEVLLPYVVKNDLGGSASDLGRRGPGRDSQRRHLRRTGTATTQHHLHVRLLDRRDAVDRGLRARAGELAADGGVLHVQSARDGGDDHLGDRQAAPRPAEPAGAGLELRLADLDRPAAGVVRPHGADCECHRRPRDAHLGGRRGQCRHARCIVPARHARDRGHPVTGRHSGTRGAAGATPARRGRTARRVGAGGLGALAAVRP
jgi:hypothetical protein